ncbi:hypothetical protein ABZ639_24705 [Saccharomonospora sp. NPDC006951]
MELAAAGAWFVLAVFVVGAWDRINSGKSWRRAALGLTMVFSLAHQLVFATVADEAYLTFRYASNVADGYGPVFNPGERVEGYSSFLWLVLVALTRAAFGGDETTIVVGASVIGVLCALGAVYAANVLANRIVATQGGRAVPALGVAAAVLTAGASSLAVYGASGVETSLFVLLVLSVCIALTSDRPVVAGVLAAFAVMTRPEGTFVALVVLLWLLFAVVRRSATGWAPLGYALGAAVLLVPWMVWRVTYYGHLVSNAVELAGRTDTGTRLASGWDYVAGFATGYLALVLLAVLTVGYLLANRRAESPPAAKAASLVWLLLALAGAQTVAVLFAGGESLPGWRLLAPVPPLIAVAVTAAYGLSGHASSKPSPRPRPRDPVGGRAVPLIAVAVSGLSLLAGLTQHDVLSSVRQWAVVGDELGELGDWLGGTLPAGTVVGSHAGGALAYRAGPGLTVVDLNGRTDEYIGRTGKAGDADVDHYVVVQRIPNVIVGVDDGYESRKRCGISPAYAGLYEVATFRRLGTEQWVALSLRRPQADSLIERLGSDPRFEYQPCA